MHQQPDGVRFEPPNDAQADADSGGVTDTDSPVDGDGDTPRGVESLSTTADLHLRSYDHQSAYDLSVELVDADGETAFENRYYLQPGDTESEADAVPRGVYEVRVTVDNDRRESFECHIGSAGTHTAVVEVGNGTVSLTEGLRI